MATNVGDMYVDLKLNIKNLEKGVKQSQKELQKISKNTKKTNKEFQLFNNNMVRSIRRLETVAVAALGVYHAFDKLIYAGVRLNQQYEDQSIGIAALTSAKTKFIDVSGKELNAYESFLAAQQLTASTMDDIKKAALDTPASFQQMIGFYQQTIGHAITENNTFGKSMEEVNDNVITFTQRMSALGSAAGMEMPKINEEIRSLMSGNASTDSLLAMMLFGSPTEANEAVRDAKKRTDGLSTLLLDALKPFEQVQGVMTYTKALAQMNAAFDDIKRNSMNPLFEDIKEGALWIKDYLTKNTEEFVAEWHKSYAQVKAWFTVVSEGFTDIYGTIGDIIGDIGEILDGMWSWNKTLLALEQGFAAISLFVKGIRLGILGLKLSEAHLGKMTGYASDLTDEEEKRYTLLKKLQGVMGEQTDDYKELIRLKEKSEGKSNEKILKIEKEIAEVRKEAGEQTYKFTEEGRKESEARFTAIQKEYSLITAIRNSQDMWDLTASYTAAKEQARDTLEVQQKIDDVYGEQLRKIEIAAKLKEVLAKGGGVAEETNKTNSKALAKQQRDQDKLLKDWNDSLDDLREEYEEWSTRFADTFASAFDQALHGDVFGAFANMFDQIGSELMKPFVEDMSKQLSSMLSNVTSGLGALGGFGAGLIGVGIGMAIDSFMQDEVETPPELTDLADTSDSMLNALNSIEDVQYPMLELTRNMTDYLKTISMSFGSVGNSLTRSGIDFGGGSFIPSSKTGTLFGSDSTDLYGTSLTFDPATVGSLLAGDLNAYRTDVIEWVKTTWYGRKKVRYIEDVTDISELIAEDLQNATEAVFSGLIGAGGYLGIDTSSLLGQSIDIGKIDTTGMSGDEIAAELEARFSAQVDAIAEDLFGVLIPFQEAGEGLAETLFRITYETEQASQMFSMVGKYISGWEESATILQQSGGLGAFTANMNDFMALFTDEQQQQMKIDALTAQFTALGYALPATNAAFIDLVNSTTDPKLYADLLSLSGAFGDLGLEVDDVTGELEDNTDALKAYQEALLAFNNDILDRITAAYTGSLNYMNSVQRAAALSELASERLTSGDTQGYFDTLYQQLDAEKSAATTVEEYKLSFDRYIAELQNAEYEPKTTDDVVDTLEELIEQNKRIEEAIANAAYQAPLNTAYTGV